MCVCVTKGHCLVTGPSRSGLWFDLMILKVFSSLDYSVILLFVRSSGS